MDATKISIADEALERINSERILITGASGLLGRQIVYELTRAGISPVCLVREGSQTDYLSSLDLEIRVAALRAQSALDSAFRGIESVIHTAAVVDFRGDRQTIFTGINSFGALACYRAARERRARRFVHVSSVVAVGALPRTPLPGNVPPLDESADFNLSHLRIPYILSKRSAEELLFAERNSETELIVVNPSIIVAPSRHGSDRERIDRALSRRFIPVPPNRFNLVDLRDVSAAIVNSLALGTDGGRYLLTGQNLVAGDVLTLFEKLTQKKPWRIRPPRSVLNLAASFNEFRRKRWSSGKLKLYPDLVRMLDYDWAYDNSLARRELGFTPRSVEDTLADLYFERFEGTFLDPP
ncbi:MAG: NAD-dependent epimerase/dehydratase family protein [Candidatus Zixiibacteriota bacterium]